jgi:L-seryl-tRNA(Ser) seleniumtransferase
MEDLGSGALVDMSRYGLADEPMPQASIIAGADVVTFSGDKLLGGPQAGIIVGRQEHISAIKKNPLKRALRVDKLTLSSLGALLQILRSSREPEKEIPTLGMMARSVETIHEMAQSAYNDMGTNARTELSAEIIDGESQVGGGSYPAQTLPTRLLALKPSHGSADALGEQLRRNNPPIIGIIRKDSFCLDFRTIQSDDLPEIITALRGVASTQT